jgi:hypothetical protein
MTKEKAVSLLSQMFLIQFSKEEHEALAMAIDALNADRKTESNSSEKPNNCETCANGEGDIEACGYCRHGDLYEPKTEPQTERSE